MAIGLAACGSAQPAPLSGGTAQPAPVTSGASEFEPWAADCATKETFVASGDTALEGVIVDCMTGEKLRDVQILATGIAGTAALGDAISDASGRYRLQLPEGRYRVLIGFEDVLDAHDLEIEIRAQHATVKEIRLEVPRCPSARSSPALVQQADIDALVAAVLDHQAAAGIVDAPRRPGPGPTYVTVRGWRTVALPPDLARHYIVTTQDELQRVATGSGRDIWFINISKLELAGSCATVYVGGDFVAPPRPGTIKMCCCNETEVFLRRGGRWAFRMSGGGACI
jgi:hypothetical protein